MRPEARAARYGIARDHLALRLPGPGRACRLIADLELQDELLDLAAHIIERKTGPFDVSRYEDRYENALLDLIKAKQSGHEVQPAETPQPTNVINLMDALRRSIAAEKGGAEKPRSPEPHRGSIKETLPKRRAAAAASARDKVRKSLRSKKSR
jgi:DNA end-binding protein Ku